MDPPICQEGAGATPAPETADRRADPGDRFFACTWHRAEARLEGGILSYAGGHEYDGCVITIEFPGGIDAVSDAEMETVFAAIRVLVNAQLAELGPRRFLAP